LNKPELYKPLIRCDADLEKYTRVIVLAEFCLDRLDLRKHFLNSYPNADGIVFVFTDRNAALMFKLALA